MNLPSMHCPFCRAELAPVSPGQDYFCSGCLTAVCLAGPIAHVYQPESGASFTLPSTDLRPD